MSRPKGPRPAETYRAYRRNLARAAGVIWRLAARGRSRTGQVTVLLPPGLAPRPRRAA